MKKICRCLVAVFAFYSSEAFAFVPPPGPLSPVFDFINDGIEAGKAQMKKIKTYAQQLQEIRDEALNKIKSAKNFIGLDFVQSPLKKEEGTPTLASAKEIADSQIADMNDASSVSEAYQTLFLQYPLELLDKVPSTQREAFLSIYHNKRVEFANDSMMELSLAIRDLEKNRMPAIHAEIESLSECYVEGKEGASSLCQSASAADEELGNRANEYKLESALDSTLRVYQETICLKAQYESGVALQNGVEPFNKDEVEKTRPAKENMSYDVHHQMLFTSAFAQASKSSLLQQNDVAAQPLKKQEQKQTRKIENPALALEESTAFQKHTPFEGAEDQLNALPVLEGAYEMLSEAQKMHNTKQQLPNLRKPFLEYEKMNALHRVAVDKLAQAELNSRDYFGTYYPLANDLWFGKGCQMQKIKLGKKCPTVTGCKGPKDYDDYYTYHILCPRNIFSATEYEKKDGLSGYVISAYKLSKADKILNMKGDMLGYVNEGGSVVDFSGKKIGVLGADKKSVVDENGKSLGTVVSQALAADTDDLGTIVMDFNTDLKVPEFGKEPDLRTMIGSGDDLVSTSAEDEATQSVREQGLNRWQIGAAAAELVGRDMQSISPAFGMAKIKYGVWGDEKRFYRQYLDKKYENMSLYLQSPRAELSMFDFAAAINDSMEVDQKTLNDYNTRVTNSYQVQINSAESDYSYWSRKYNAAESGSDEEKEALSERNAASRKISSLKRERDNQIAQHKKEVEEKLNREKTANAASIASAKTSWTATVEAFEESSELSKMQEAHEKARDNLVSSFIRAIRLLNENRDLASQEIDEVMIALNEKKQKYNDFIGLKKDAEEGALAEEENIERIDERKKQDPSYVTELEGYVGMRDMAVQRKAENEKQAAQAKTDADQALEGIEDLQDQIEQLKNQIAAIDKQIENTKKSYINQAVALEHVQHEEMKEALSQRASLTPQVPTVLLSASTATISPIYAMSRVLVKTFKDNADQAVKKAYLSLLSLGDRLYDPDSYSLISKIHKQMLDEMAAKNGYVLSKNVVSELLMSNKSILENASTMLFSTMFGNKGAYENEDTVYMVSMNAGTRDFYAPKRILPERTPPIREVFHLDSADYDAILKTDAIKKVSNPKTTRLEFLRMGQFVASEMMPSIWRSILGPRGFVERDVDVEDILNTNASDKQAKEFLDAKGEIPVSKTVGELSVFLKYDNGLTFRDDIYELAKYFDDAEQGNIETDEDEMKENEKKMLTRNQVGDYLQFMDLEKSYQTTISQLKVKVDEGRRAIESVLEKVSCPYQKKETGYIKENEVKTKIVSTEFIADEETYEAISKCLDEGKNMFIKEAQGLLASLPNELSEFVATRKEKLDNMIKALQMDNEELVTLSDNTEANDELSEQIKTKRTDAAVVGKYGEEAQAEFEKNLDQFEVPYRAKYE